jgi:hypothetical protein
MDTQERSLQPNTDLERHLQIVADAMARNRLVPFLGAGVSLCDRPTNAVWDSQSSDLLPSGRELANFLASTPGIPDSADVCNVCKSGRVCQCGQPTQDLTRISQSIATFLEEGPLYDKLHDVFARSAGPTCVHDFLATLSARCRNNDYPLIATTNYDDLMETALSRGQEFDVIFYDPPGYDDRTPHGPRFCHRDSKGRVRVIAEGNADATPYCSERPLVLKLHGTIDRRDAITRVS